MESLNGSAENASLSEMLDTSRSSYGEMASMEATPQGGTKMFRIGKLLMGKSFEITVVHLVLAVGILALVAGFMAGIKFDRSKLDEIHFSGHKWVMVGMMQMQEGIYMPVYKDENVVLRDMRPAQ